MSARNIAAATACCRSLLLTRAIQLQVALHLPAPLWGEEWFIGDSRRHILRSCDDGVD